MNFAEKLKTLEDKIQAACIRVQRAPEEIQILAVSKQQPTSAIEEAYEYGLRHFGENYVQELSKKKEKEKHLKEIRWHLIGSLQSNKAKQAVTHADFFHALDSKKLAVQLAKQVASLRLSKPWPVFIEVNIDEEPTKKGVTSALAEELAEFLEKQNFLALEGLMCIPKEQQNPNEVRSAFHKLASLAHKISSKSRKNLCLSMGMSNDFEAAIEEGSRWIRIGRLLFGSRQ